jgi:ligand-binding sensor domain-containing protein
LPITFLFFFLFVLFLTNKSFALDNFEIKNLTQVNKLLQDEYGFIWLGGQQGLTRFDGKQSINFSSDNPNHLLPFNWIHDFAQDNDLLIMATETHGLWSVNIKTGQAKPIITDIGNNSFYDVTIFRDNYYFQTENSLYEYQPTTGNTYLITNNIIIDGIASTKEHLYVFSASGLYLLEGRALTKVMSQPVISILTIDDTLVAVTTDKIYLIRDTGEKVSIANNRNIYQTTRAYKQPSFFAINNQGKISKYSTHNLEKLHHGFENTKSGRVRKLLHDSSGVLWLTSNQGVDRLYENTVKNHPKVFDIITNANEITLFNDEIVIGSYGVGLQNFTNQMFNHKTNSNFTPNGLKITNLAIVNSELFVATFDGLWQLDKQLNQVNRVDFPHNNKLILKLKSIENTLYIATNNNGLYAYDLKKQSIIWNIRPKDGLSSAEVIDILPLNNGQIWLTTAKGLDIYDSNTEQIKNVEIPGANKLVSITLADNKIFAASLGDGIFAFNLQGQILAHISPGISFSGLLLEKDNIWASARPGLYQLNPKNHQVSMLENTGKYSFIGSSLMHNDILYSSHYGGILELDLTKKPIFNPKVVISETTISGESYLLNKTIKVAGSNDLITLDLASLDYRPGLAKKYKYRINDNKWQPISGAQLTLTGLASGDYNIEIMATNSLGQWSDIKAYTEINVAYPWYWTIELKILYSIITLFIILLSAWLLFLRTKSIKNIHNLLKDDMKNCGRIMKTIQRNLQLTSTSLSSNEIEHSKQLIEKSLLMLKESLDSQEPDSLAGKDLSVAVPFLANYIQSKYDVKLHCTLDDKVDGLNYELKSDVYKVIFEALISAIFKSEAQNFNLTLKEVKKKLWLSINSDNDSFNQLNSRINFDLASYTIRQITNKHHASLNTFDNDDGSSQLVISFPLMALN